MAKSKMGGRCGGRELTGGAEALDPPPPAGLPGLGRLTGSPLPEAFSPILRVSLEGRAERQRSVAWKVNAPQPHRVMDREVEKEKYPNIPLTSWVWDTPQGCRMLSPRPVQRNHAHVSRWCAPFAGLLSFPGSFPSSSTGFAGMASQINCT